MLDRSCSTPLSSEVAAVAPLAEPPAGATDFLGDEGAVVEGAVAEDRAGATEDGGGWAIRLDVEHPVRAKATTAAVRISSRLMT
jgi:hypothetical protein